MLAFRIFDDSGFSKKLRAVPEDDEGIDIEFLKKEISKSEDKAQQEGNNTPVSRTPLFDHLVAHLRALSRSIVRFLQQPIPIYTTSPVPLTFRLMTTLYGAPH